jgi:hypothetical protein
VDSYQRQEMYNDLGQQIASDSDYLTRRARRFAITNDQKHLESYWTKANKEPLTGALSKLEKKALRATGFRSWSGRPTSGTC